MKNLFNDISQDEKNRILEMHQSATRKNYLSEQGTPTGATNSPATKSDPIIPLMSAVTNVDTFLQGITPTQSEIQKYFKFPAIPPTDNPQTDPNMIEQRNFLDLLNKANAYYVKSKMSPRTSKLTAIYNTHPTVMKTKEPAVPGKNRFTTYNEEGLNQMYYNYLTNKLSGR
jgi:hypothetical protein